MAKPHYAGIAKRSIPNGAKRITNAQGKRVWLYNKVEYGTKRELVHRNDSTADAVVITSEEVQEKPNEHIVPENDSVPQPDGSPDTEVQS